ncbi:hypothetical protein GCM10022631_32180 [Deinococcus rubellus]|uniref:Uncharacterized protein n=1 Tax=Deinococcus rubellus TaxID=1889240 RepID=A0ABY5YMW7_9DEIO|nr:hypothetical protein [Deinococcus rubellus]UWX65093.1 hypothetical protein N0D28_05395 [Deinococcus rubellus]
MNNRVVGLMVALLVLLNVGGVIVVMLSLGRGDWRGLGTLAWVLGLDLAGFWLLRQLRK